VVARSFKSPPSLGGGVEGWFGVALLGLKRLYINYPILASLGTWNPMNEKSVPCLLLHTFPSLMVKALG